MNKTTFSTPKAPIPSSHIAQVSCYGSVGFLSGQISQDRQTGEVIRDTVAGQTRRILTNIRTILEEMGLGLENVIKCNVFLSSMDHFDEMDAVYKTFFSSANPPARQTVSAGIWADLDIEISAEIILDHLTD